MISMYLFDDLHKWEYNTGKSQTQLKSEFRKITNGWMIVALWWKKSELRLQSYMHLCYL